MYRIRTLGVLLCLVFFAGCCEETTRSSMIATVVNTKNVIVHHCGNYRLLTLIMLEDEMGDSHVFYDDCKQEIKKGRRYLIKYCTCSTAHTKGDFHAITFARQTSAPVISSREEGVKSLEKMEEPSVDLEQSEM